MSIEGDGAVRHILSTEYLIIPFDGTERDLNRLKKTVPKGFHVAGYRYTKPFSVTFVRNIPKKVIELDAP